MNYEEKYKQALERASKLRVQNPFDTVGQMVEHIFPELKEDNDERIRKELIAIYSVGAKVNAKTGDIPDRDIVAWLEKQEEPKDKGEISDGYHTFNELYNYRMLYNAAFFNMLPKEIVHKSKRHHDGEECFGGGWFVVMANLPTGQISNHYELKNWDLFQIPEKEIADEWDGHTPQEAAERLHKYLLEKQCEQKPIKASYTTIVETGDGGINALVKRDLFTDGCYDEKNPSDKVEPKTLNADEVIAWLVGNICDFEYYVKRFKQDFVLC